MTPTTQPDAAEEMRRALLNISSTLKYGGTHDYQCYGAIKFAEFSVKVLPALLTELETLRAEKAAGAALAEIGLATVKYEEAKESYNENPSRSEEQFVNNCADELDALVASYRASREKGAA